MVTPTVPKLLDLFCCAGGAGAGYARAGFDVYGVDIDPQPRNPHMFHQGDAISTLNGLLAGAPVRFTTGDEVAWLTLEDFDAIHASPPCQLFTGAANIATLGTHLDLLTPTRELLQQTGLPYIIENVPGAPMTDYVTLCGSEFHLVAPDRDGVLVQLRRHRQFESNVWLVGAGGCSHDPTMVTASIFGQGGANTLEKRDDPTRSKGYIPHDTVCAQLLGVDWMNKREMSECIPPAYTAFLGAQLLEHLEHANRAARRAVTA